MSSSTDLSTPLTIVPDMSLVDLELEVNLMLIREMATAEFLAGTIDGYDWLDTLAECGYDVDTAVRDWTNGASYMS
jgi:hypothetical protein